jgi:type IV secretory pathway VirB4 component
LFEAAAHGAYRVKDEGYRERLYDELVNYLSFCISGDLNPIAIPPCAMYLDTLLGIPELWTGDTPKLGETFIAIAALDGFPHETFPGMLARLDALAIPYRFSTRFIPLDGHEAIAELHKYRRKWRQWMRGFWSQVFKTQGGYVNEDAGRMARQSEDAITDANSGLVSFGYYTPVVFRGESPKIVLDQARLVAGEVRRDGFSAPSLFECFGKVKREANNQIAPRKGSSGRHVRSLGAPSFANGGTRDHVWRFIRAERK